MKKIITIIVIATFALPINLLAAETDLTLAWDPNTPAPFGYQLFCREAGQNYDYSNPVWEGDNSFTQCTIDQLDDTKIYYFVVRAVNDIGDQSASSNEIRFPEEAGAERSLGGGDSGMSSSSCFIQSLLSP